MLSVKHGDEIQKGKTAPRSLAVNGPSHILSIPVHTSPGISDEPFMDCHWPMNPTLIAYCIPS